MPKGSQRFTGCVYMYSSDGVCFILYIVWGSFCDVNLYPQMEVQRSEFLIIYKALLYISK